MSFSIDLFTGGVCRRTGSAIAAAFCIGTAGVNAQNIADELSPTQRQELQKGAPVCIQEEVPGIAWPRSTVFQKIAGVQPEEVIAVFFDYQGAKTFIPNVQISKIMKSHAAWKQEVYYELELPLMLPNEQYTATNELMDRSTAGVYEVKWSVEKGRFFTSSKGSLRVQAWQDGSLLRYETLVNPGSRIAALLRPHARQQVLDVVKAIAKRAETMKKKHPGQLEALTESVRGALVERARSGTRPVE